jgi:hypothetical protein
MRMFSRHRRTGARLLEYCPDDRKSSAGNWSITGHRCGDGAGVRFSRGSGWPSTTGRQWHQRSRRWSRWAARATSSCRLTWLTRMRPKPWWTRQQRHLVASTWWSTTRASTCRTRSSTSPTRSGNRPGPRRFSVNLFGAANVTWCAVRHMPAGGKSSTSLREAPSGASRVSPPMEQARRPWRPWANHWRALSGRPGLQRPIAPSHLTITCARLSLP